MSVNLRWLTLLAALQLLCQSPVGADPLGADPLGADAVGAVEPPTADAGLQQDAQSHLRTALQAIRQKSNEQAEAEIHAAISDPKFPGLGEDAQRVALTTAASLALQSHAPDQAQQLARRATELSGAGIDDWQMRLSASLQLHDARDEAIALTAIARAWGRDRSNLPDSTVRRVALDTRSPSLDALRLNLLDALYAANWTDDIGGTSSTLWRDLACLLLARGDKDQAIMVASSIDGPYDVIGLRADARFRPLRHHGGVPEDVRAVMRARQDHLHMIAKTNPRSLQAFNAWLRTLLVTGDPSQVLALSDSIASHATARDYDDLGREQNWTLDIRARAFVRLGRSEEAVAELQRAAALPGRRDLVSQPINLAWLLCELGRPGEALAALPQFPGKPSEAYISPYGLMQVALVRLAAAIELEHAPEAAEALEYLRAHRSDSVATLQEGLLLAGKEAEAAQVLVERLEDTSERTTALAEIQTYAEVRRPPLAVGWHMETLRLEARPDVQRAVYQVGTIERYPWFAPF